MNRLWKIKHWIKYTPSIYFFKYIAKLFGLFANITDGFGEWVWGAKRWREIKLENGIDG